MKRSREKTPLRVSTKLPILGKSYISEKIRMEASNSRISILKILVYGGNTIEHSLDKVQR